MVTVHRVQDNPLESRWGDLARKMVSPSLPGAQLPPSPVKQYDIRRRRRIMHARLVGMVLVVQVCVPAGVAYAHGVTLWMIILFGMPFVVAITALMGMLGGLGKRHLMRWQLGEQAFPPWSDLIPAFLVELVAIPASLLGAGYLIEEVASMPFRRDVSASALMFMVTCLLSAAVLMIPHMRLVAATFTKRGIRVSVADRIGFSLLLSLMTPGLFSLGLIGLMLMLW